jgi:hypothetical protein
MGDSKQKVASPAQFKQLLASDSIRGANVRMAANGRGLIVELDVGEPSPCLLGALRGGPRYFRSFDGAASVLLQYGLDNFNATATGWVSRSQPAGRKIKRYDDVTAASA